MDQPEIIVGTPGKFGSSCGSRMNGLIASKYVKFKRPLFFVAMICFLIFWISDDGSPTLPDGANRLTHMGKELQKYPASLLNRYSRSEGNGQSSGSSSSWLRSMITGGGWNKDPEIVIILAANEGGGVLRWKNEQDWAIERLSIDNKRAYAKRHGYGLTIKDLTVAKRYSHEYREGWQKVDILKQTMREFSTAQWFWWLDMDTLIMEPEFSLEDHIFSKLDNLTDRTLESFNPLKIETDIPYVDYTEELNLLITQDCGGFNLGSFLIKNTEWSKLLLELWWEPAMYEQKHMVWEHREQDVLEALYANEGWIRSRVGFLPLRSINAFPPGACSEFTNDKRYFYNENEKDFVVNMAGCNFGRDCWGEMQLYTSKLEHKNKRWYNKLFF